MAQKWNLQDIKPAGKRKRLEPTKQGGLVHTPTHTAPVREEIPNIRIEDGNQKKRSKGWLAAITFIVIIVGGIVASAFMSGAELTVHPRFREPNLNATFTSYPEPRANELSYEIMSLEATGERQVTASGEETVTEQATGEIEIIKTTAGSERLIKNTRFESPNGLIFRIEESVVVPGAVDSVPGTIRARVFAESPGDEYNLLSGTTLTIPGFAENGFDDLFQSITAVNRADITGGFDGPRFIIDDDELATARQSLQMELRDSLLERVPTERPAGFTTFDSAVAFTYVELPAVEYGNNLVTIREQAILQLPLYQERDFANYIAAATVPGYEGNPVRIDNLSDLTFTYTSATTSATNIANETSIEFNLAGRPLLVWVYDPDKLKADLLGVPKTALSNILSSYPAIESASAVVRPFWKRSFPTDMSDIDVIEMLKEE
ncbi:MAG: hypothetical protein AAGA35_00335 [Patescibacteria group bacterium]